MIDVVIPVPPSANALFANRRGGRGGRFKTPRYTQWITAAGWELLMQHPVPIAGRYRLNITLPMRDSADPDNRIKAISDLLVTHRLIEDDRKKYCRGITIIPTDGPGQHARVQVIPCTP